MIKIKIIGRENPKTGQVEIQLEKFIDRGTKKEQIVGAQLYVAASQMLVKQNQLNDLLNDYYVSTLEKEDLEILEKIGG